MTWFEMLALALLTMIAAMLLRYLRAVAYTSAQIWGEIAVLRAQVEGYRGSELTEVVIKRTSGGPIGCGRTR